MASHVLISKSFYRNTHVLFSLLCSFRLIHPISFSQPCTHFKPNEKLSLTKLFSEFRLNKTSAFCLLGNSGDGAFEVQAWHSTSCKQALAGTAFPPHKDLPPLPRVLWSSLPTKEVKRTQTNTLKNLKETWIGLPKSTDCVSEVIRLAQTYTNAQLRPQERLSGLVLQWCAESRCVRIKVWKIEINWTRSRLWHSKHSVITHSFGFLRMCTHTFIWSFCEKQRPVLSQTNLNAKHIREESLFKAHTSNTSRYEMEILTLYFLNASYCKWFICPCS